MIAAASGNILLARRPPHVHQGNRWEFPGGKAKSGEGRFEALVREIDEELGITIVEARPLIRIPHRYPEREVLLDVWRVVRYIGQPRGREGQELRWVRPEALADLELPDANRPIVAAVTLPELYLITPEPGPDDDAFIARLSGLCAAGIRLVQFRARTLSPERFETLARAAIAVCRDAGARIVINSSPGHAIDLGADGVHLSQERLMRLPTRPVAANRLLAASCHDAEAVAQAARIGADFVAIAPVLATATHPDAAVVLGWAGLEELCDRATMPAYALGGMTPEHLAQAWRHGAQGIAAIRSLWNLKSRSSSA